MTTPIYTITILAEFMSFFHVGSNRLFVMVVDFMSVWITSENPTRKSNNPGSPHAARVPACQTSHYSY